MAATFNGEGDDIFFHRPNYCRVRYGAP
jgi:hypothetical protein